MKHIRAIELPLPETSRQRACERLRVELPARLTWKDSRGTTRFASVVTRDISERGVFVECQSSVAIPLYRLVEFQLERDVREADPVPGSLRRGRVLAAVYRISAATASGKRQGLALRLMVIPKRQADEVPEVEAPAASRATA